MKYLLLILLISVCHKNRQEIIQTNTEFRAGMNAEFNDPEETPLLEEDLATFTELPFFEIDTAFYIIAKFERAVDAEAFEMKTTTDRKPIYKLFGVATFKIKGEEFKLQIFQNQKLIENEEYKNYLFLPFTDLTGGEECYAGGRFIDLQIPEGDKIVIDFNKAYNPLCAYNHKYSCPIPPAENFLNVRIAAGVQYKAH